MDLTQQTCKPCRGDEPPLAPEEFKKYHEAVPEWELLTKPRPQLVREFTLSNFSEVITFIERVAELAESEGHHPNLYLHEYKHLKIEVYTHKIQGLHANDFILASKIDQLWQQFSA